MRFTSNFSKYASYLFLAGVFIILLPQFRLPFMNYGWMDTSFLGRSLLLIVFVFYSIRVLVFGKSNRLRRSFYLEIIVVFFVLQSLSILGAVNVGAFLKAYEKLVFGFIAFLITLSLMGRNKSKLFEKVILVFFLAGAIKLFMEFFLFFAPDSVSRLTDFFLKLEAAQFIKANLNRQRTYIDLLGEISLPFFLYYFFKAKGSKPLRLGGLLLAGLLGLVAFLSNWRGRILVYIVLLLASLLVFRKLLARRLLFVVLGVAMLVGSIYIADQIQVVTRGFSVFDRLMNRNIGEDEMPIRWRLGVFQESIDMARSSFFGVGLKNFYDRSESRSKARFFRLRKEEATIDEPTLHGPHNIFFQFLAETGFIGLFAFILMLVVFLIKDFRTIVGVDSLWLKRVTIILAFWALILTTQFYPATTLGFYVSFFLFRALLMG